MNYRTITLKSRTSGAYRTVRTDASATASVFVCDERLHDYVHDAHGVDPLACDFAYPLTPLQEECAKDAARVQTVCDLFLAMRHLPEAQRPTILHPAIAAPYSQPKENRLMKIENVTLIDGVRADTFDDDALIAMITECEHRIEHYKGIKTPSRKITAKIEELEQNIAQLVKLLDARE